MRGVRAIEFSYPLEWPTWWKRTEFRRLARFTDRWTVSSASARVALELDRLGASSAIVSTNLRARADGGGVLSGQARPQDPGAAVHFDLRGRSTCLACDRWNEVQDNLRALSLHIEALRGLDRWGVGSLEQAFAGYAALPERGGSSAPWREVLGLNGHSTETDVRAAFARLVKAAHPDAGGSAGAFERLVRARDEALRELGA